MIDSKKIKMMLVMLLVFAVALAIGPSCGKGSNAGDEGVAGVEEVEIDAQPELVQCDSPPYPQEAKVENRSGAVWVKAFVSETGKVTDVELDRSSGHGDLDAAALDKAWDCTYKPALKNDKPVAVWVTYQVQFALEESKSESE